MPVLASELIDTVIDFLHGDRSSLCACALASKFCLPSARYHLFSEIEVNAENFPSFLSLVEATSHIAPLVRGLTVRGGARILGVRGRATPADVFLAQNMSRVAPSLYNVIHLEIASLDWDFPTLETLEHSLAAFGTKIRRLELNILRFRTFKHVTDFICYFSNLRHLNLNSVTWTSDCDPHTVRRLRMLEALTVHTGEFLRGKSAFMLAWLHIQCPPPKLISATFRVSEFDSRHVIPPTFGETLQNLHISVFRHISEETLGGTCTV